MKICIEQKQHRTKFMDLHLGDVFTSPKDKVGRFLMKIEPISFGHSNRKTLNTVNLESGIVTHYHYTDEVVPQINACLIDQC